MEQNISYCGEHCPIGKAEKRKCLDNSESVFDAVMDFWYFADECKKTCIQKVGEHNENK